MPFGRHFDPEALPWEWLGGIKEALAAFDFEADARDDVPSGARVEGPVFLHPTVKLPPYCVIQGPAWIGAEVEIRPGAYIRGNAIVGAGSVLGNSSEYKNCLLMERAKTPHYNYVGDSILGSDTHLGAGVIVSNLRLDQQNVPVRVNGRSVDSGRRKLGAILGDGAEVGCNAVLNPGSIVGRRSLVGPLVSFRGTLGPGRICLVKQSCVEADRLD